MAFPKPYHWLQSHWGEGLNILISFILLVFSCLRGEGNGTPLQYSSGKSHGWRSLVGCSPWGREDRRRLSDFPFTFHFHALEKEVATHSSVFGWRIPGTGEPGGLLSMGSPRVGHDWSDLAAAAAAAAAACESKFLSLGFSWVTLNSLYMSVILQDFSSSTLHFQVNM